MPCNGLFFVIISNVNEVPSSVYPSFNFCLVKLVTSFLKFCISVFVSCLSCILIDTDMLETVLSILYYYFTICKDRHGENILVGCFCWTYSHRHYVAAIFMVICEGQVRPQRGFSFVLVFQSAKKLYSLCNVIRQPS